jgi:hypothetical protein
MTTFGMEFEVQGVSVRKAHQVLNEGGIVCDLPDRTHNLNPNWKAVYDGSVSNGAEVVSPILNESRLNEAVAVAKILKKAGARVDTATGFHVHIGISAFGNATNSALSQFVLNYYSMHHAIGALVAPSRLRNQYCKVLNQHEAEDVASYVDNGGLRSPNGNRYVSLNLESIDRHGTVEVRLHQGTLNGVKAIAWSQFIAGLIEISKQGVNLNLNDALNPWADPRSRDAESCATLLDTLVSFSCLNASTADWLKNRARTLKG